MKKALLFILCLHIHLSHANYEVEVLVFQHHISHILDEQWNTYPKMPNWHQAIDLDNHHKAIHPLPDTSLGLIGAANNMKRTGRYKILYHSAWQQKSLSPDLKPVLIAYKLDNSASITPIEDDEALIDANTVDEHAETFDRDLKWKTKGLIQVSHAKYLKLNANLFLNVTAKEIKAAKLNQTQLKSVLADRPWIRLQLKAQQKLSFDQIHYIDHPMFGMLVQVRKIELAAE